MPDASMVPTVALPPVVPFTCHVTAVLVVPVTVAIKTCKVPVLTWVTAGFVLTVTATFGLAVMVAWADPEIVPSACDVAVIVTVAGVGIVAGA